MKRLRIFSDSPFPPEEASRLREGVAPHEIIVPAKQVSSVLDTAEVDPAFGEAEIAFGQPSLESIETSDRLRWIHVSSAGFTRYDTPEFRALAKKRQWIVTNSSSVYDRACAEHVLAFMLAQSRCLPQALGSSAPSGDPEWLALRNRSISLQGKTLVILGFGAIARHVVRLLAPFEMKIIAMRRTPRGNEGVQTITAEELPKALAKADHVMNILPDNADSREFVNASRLAAMKRGAVFYNIGRGTSVNQDDLLDALQSEQLAAAWLDVTEPEPLPHDHPLRKEPNCFITPHTAGGHENEAGTLVDHFLENFHRYIAGEDLRDRII